MLDVVSRAPTEVFWHVFLETWSMCDDTNSVQRRLMRQLRSRGSGIEHLNADARAFFDRLPDPAKVYRGCARERIRRIAWTTDREVARSVAVGHRGIRVPRAVVVAARIPKDAVYAVFLGRGESEVLVEPRWLQAVAVVEDLSSGDYRKR